MVPFRKSKLYAILKSLQCSPLCIVMFVFFGFYTLYSINIYLISAEILWALDKKDDSVEGNAIIWITIELLIGIVCGILVALFLATKEKLEKDLVKYELESVAWQK